tara:strand:+ start:117 stop:632 length:516 start_codon:yes stop_codon:yes gene_type:complete
MIHIRDELIYAVNKGDAEEVAISLANPMIDVNAEDSKFGMTALILATMHDNISVVDALLAHPEIDPNTVDSGGKTALYWAAFDGYTEIVEALLANPVTDVNKADNNGATPMHVADFAVTEALLVHPDIDVNKADRYGIENAPQIRDALFNTDEFPMKEKSQGTQPIKYSEF